MGSRSDCLQDGHGESDVVTGRWSDAAPTAIDIDEWVEGWLPDLDSDGVRVAVFQTPDDEGVGVSPQRLKHDLDEESSTSSNREAACWSRARPNARAALDASSAAALRYLDSGVISSGLVVARRDSTSSVVVAFMSDNSSSVIPTSCRKSTRPYGVSIVRS